MDRREFLSKLSVGAIAAIGMTCLGSSCDQPSTSASATNTASTSNTTTNNTTSNTTTTSNVDFNVDLTALANSALASNGGYIINSTNKIVVAKGTDGKYYAATIVCAHEGQTQVTYSKINNNYSCSAHGATFDLAGKATSNVTGKSITTYKTTLSSDGKTLRVYA